MRKTHRRSRWALESWHSAAADFGSSDGLNPAPFPFPPSPMSYLVDWIRWLMGLAQPENLQALVNLSGPWWVSYLILSAIIFSETGLLVGFFLPGDSLLFAAGLL